MKQVELHSRLRTTSTENLGENSTTKVLSTGNQVETKKKKAKRRYPESPKNEFPKMKAKLTRYIPSNEQFVGEGMKPIT